MEMKYSESEITDEKKLIQVYWFLQDFLRIIFCSSSWIDKLYLLGMAQHGNWCHRNLSRETISIPKKENFSQVALVVPEVGWKIPFQLWFQKKEEEETGKQQIRASQKFFRPRTFPNSEHASEQDEIGKTEKQQISLRTNSWSYFKDASCMKQEKEERKVFFSFWTEFIFSIVQPSTSWVTLTSFESFSLK